MTSSALIANDDLPFAQSESRAVGLRGNLLKTIRDNAPRIVAALKLAGDVSLGFSLNPFLITHTVFSGIGRILLMMYGTKSNQKQAAHNLNSQDISTATQSSALKKALHPKQYPVEASAGLSTIAEAFGIAYGVSEFAAGRTGFTPLLLGVLALGSYANILLAKEKRENGAQPFSTDESLRFAQSESASVGVLGKMRQTLKDNPVLVSSLLQLGISVGMLVGSLVEGLTPAYAVASGFFIAANIIQALFVRKNEFNIEGAQTEVRQKPLTFEEKLAQKRQQENSLGA